jgi:hypothetical protein
MPARVFQAFSCKGFHLCPSCSQKRSLLFAECLDEHLLLALPHRQFIFTLPKALRVSRLIFSLIAEFYSAAASRPTHLHRVQCRLRQELHAVSTG